MVCTATTDFSITIRPRKGLTPAHYLIFEKWVADRSEGILKMVATIEKADTEGSHYQVAAVYDRLHTSQELQRKLITRFKSLLDDDEQKHAIKVKSHRDINTLAGGYCCKENAPVYKVGFTDAELAKGDSDYQQLLNDKKKKVISKSQIPQLFKDAHYQLMCDNDYTQRTPREQVDMCVKFLLRRDFNLMVPGLLSHHYLQMLVTYWTDFTARTTEQAESDLNSIE